MRLVETTPEPVAFAPPQAEPEPAQPAVSVKSIDDIVALADKHRELAFKVLIKRYVRPVRIEPGHVQVSLTEDAPRTLLNDLTVKLKTWTGRHWVVSLSKEEGGQTLFEKETIRRETALLDARSDPAVAAVLSRFPGAKIIDVRIPDALQAEAAEDDTLPEPEADEDD
jgi:DNA polymerase-3 subunit gamma/tau